MATKTKATTTSHDVITVTPPDIREIACRIKGTAPLMQARFSAKTKTLLMDKMAAGSTARGKKERAARDYAQDMRDAMHADAQGRPGIPAAAIRAAMISACRLVGFKMTFAKMSVFVAADTLDVEDASPLVLIDAPAPEQHAMHTRNATGVVDVRVRPLWREWSATVRIRFDAGQFTASDVVNLLARAGAQVGIGEGRPDSRQSNGLGFGTFEIVAG